MPNDEFNPRSNDAMFATILAELAAIRAGQAEQLAEARKTNGRVSSLEHWRTSIKAKVAAVSAGISGAVALIAWCVEQLRA